MRQKLRSNIKKSVLAFSIFFCFECMRVQTQALAAEVTVEEWKGHSVLKLTGEIDTGTFKQLDAQSANIMPLSYGLPVLLLDSPGGRVDEAMKISDLLDRKPFHTVVPDGAKCASSCASIIFIAGKARTVEESGLLGQHSCSRDGVPDYACNEKLSAHAVEHGVSYGSPRRAITSAHSDPMVMVQF